MKSVIAAVFLLASLVGCTHVASQQDTARSEGADFTARILAIWQNESEPGYVPQAPTLDLKPIEIPISRMSLAFDRLYRVSFVQIRCAEVRLWLRTIRAEDCDQNHSYYLVRAIHNNSLSGDFGARMDSAGTLIVSFLTLGRGTVLPSALLVQVPKEAIVKKVVVYERGVR